MSEFVHLHVHTQYSLLDGLNTTDKLFEKVKSSGMDSVAISDHGSLYGVPEFWLMSRDFGVKPIIGCEIYLSPKEHTLRQDVDGIRYYHLLLLAKNAVGYKNLLKIVSISNLEGMYYKPRASLEILKKYSEGLVCTSACLAGPLSRHIMRNELDIAEDWLKKLHAIFKDDFYLEIQRNGIRCEDKVDEKLISSYPAIEREHHLSTAKSQVKVNQQLYEYSKKYKIPIIASTDAHYLNPDEKDVQKLLFCIKDGKMLNDPTAMNGYMETYIKTPEELKQDFSDIPEVLTETVKVAEKIEDFDIRYDRVQPRYWRLKKEESAREVLYKYTYLGAAKKYADSIKVKIKNPDDIEEIKTALGKDLVERIEYELQVIHDKGYDDYFLVVSDIMRWSAENEILTGVRGSVAGSVVAHCLDVVELEPIKWELYFERFLNPERPSPPDIDMDIQDSRRDELIDYVKEKYGEKSVAAICAIGRLKTKAAIRDVARVMGVDLSMADKLSKMVTVLFGKPFKFKQMMETDPQFKQIVDADTQLQELGNTVSKIEGLSRHMSVHACGYLITPGDVENYTPLQRETGGDKVITQWEGPWVEEMGLMKFDFLGLRTLSIISDTLKYIKDSGRKDINFYNIPEGDKATYELLGRGETIGVFQFESPPMQRYLIDLKPESQEDLCFMAAAYRPGPMQYIPDYIKCKHGQKEPEILIPELEPIIGSTYGFAIYQEQVIRIAVDIAGYTMGGADILRRAMGKKKKDVMEKEEIIFKEGVAKKGLSTEVGQKLWEYLLPFADYGFNKAHAAGYAVLAYKCAYLKAHYPLEFMTALMHADLENQDRIVVDMQEAKRLGFKVLPPDVNKSDTYFAPEGTDKIRFGLGAIKNVGTKVCKLIIKEREKNGDYKSLDEVINRIGTKSINKRTLECLIKAGAMDEFGERRALLEIIPMVYEKATKEEKATELGQTGLFNLGAEHDAVKQIEATKLPTVAPATDKDKAEWEKDLLGLFVSSHPLEKFQWAMLNPGMKSVEEMATAPNQSAVKAIVIFAGVKEVLTKKDSSRMAVMQLQDFSGQIDGVIFPRTYDSLSKLGVIEDGRAFLITGKVNIREDRRSVIIDTIEPAASLIKPKTLTLNISTVQDKNTLASLKNCFVEDGDTEVKILYGSKTSPKEILRKTELTLERISVLRNFLQ